MLCFDKAAQSSWHLGLWPVCCICAACSPMRITANCPKIYVVASEPADAHARCGYPPENTHTERRNLASAYRSKRPSLRLRTLWVHIATLPTRSLALYYSAHPPIGQIFRKKIGRYEQCTNPRPQLTHCFALPCVRSLETSPIETKRSGAQRTPATLLSRYFISVSAKGELQKQTQTAKSCTVTNQQINKKNGTGCRSLEEKTTTRLVLVPLLHAGDDHVDSQQQARRLKVGMKSRKQKESAPIPPHMASGHAPSPESLVHAHLQNAKRREEASQHRVLHERPCSIITRVTKYRHVNKTRREGEQNAKGRREASHRPVLHVVRGHARSPSGSLENAHP